MTTDLGPDTRVRIAEGVTIPLLGLGTWKASGSNAYNAVRHALEVGYRLVDTATMYANEEAVGQAVRDSGLDRGEVFVTTKMLPGDAGRERQGIEASLRLLGLDFVDLWLIHWPPDDAASLLMWERFVEARNQGFTRAIGVSNYSPAQIDDLTHATGVTPAINQIEWGPGRYDRDIEEAHRRRRVALEGWSPFLSTNMDDEMLAEIAEHHDVTPHQVVLRWHLQHETIAIPKSGDRGRIAENFDVFGFALSDDEVHRIDAMGA